MKKFVFVVAVSALVFACNSSPDNEAEVAAPVETAPEEVNYSTLGSLIANQTQQALGGELKAAMQRGGVAEAVAYCNLQALPITDSLARFYDVSIKRATLKPRNVQNAATENEQEIFAVWEDKKANNGEISPVLFESENAVDFYSPIVLQAMCTTCHGVKNESFSAETASIINQKYPEDKATGYAEGDLRGMWHIVFKSKK